MYGKNLNYQLTRMIEIHDYGFFFFVMFYKVSTELDNYYRKTISIYYLRLEHIFILNHIFG